MFNNSRPRGDSQAADSGQAGRVMPQLTRLSVGVDGKAINRLISCCPNLQDWDINGGETNRSIPTACGPSALDNLTQLQHLSKLTFCLTASGSGRLQPRPPSGNLPRSHLRAIVKVEGLKDLRLLMCDTVPYLADLELLTALRQLKHSSCYIPGGWGRFSPYDKDYLEDIQVEFTNQVSSCYESPLSECRWQQAVCRRKC